MATDRYDEREHRVDVEAAWENAALSIVRRAAVEAPGVGALMAGRVRKKPTTVYDINGSPLFYDFPVPVRGGAGGVVRTAASRVIGRPVVSLELGDRQWSYSDAVKRLLPRIRRRLRNQRIPRPKLVCYSYPKLGVMFEVPDRRGRPSREIYDVASLEPVSVSKRRGEWEGQTAWSYYEALDNRKRSRGVRSFDSLDGLRAKQSTDVRRRLARARQLDQVGSIAKLVLRRTRTRTLEFCPHYGEHHARGHHCFALHAQEVNDYCAVATCQMILCYYRYYYEQDDIAPSLGYSAGSGCPSDQSAGYETLSSNHIAAQFDTSATWSEARAQIDELQPMKSGVPGHARAVAGYSYVLHRWPTSITERSLYVYDPWPWNSDHAAGGSVYWEDWDAVTHTNFVYTRLDY